VRLSDYRDVGRQGEPYPPWVRALRGASGVYVLREGKTIRYIGESHTGRLYETMTRHFQHWDLPSSCSYNRDKMNAAVLVLTRADEAPAVQAYYIVDLAPTDNTYEQGEPLPF